MALTPLLPLLSLFFIFLYKYGRLMGVSRKIQGNIDNDASVSDIRKSMPPLVIHADNSCLYNHNNLCQRMNYMD